MRSIFNPSATIGGDIGGLIRELTPEEILLVTGGGIKPIPHVPPPPPPPGDDGDGE